MPPSDPLDPGRVARLLPGEGSVTIERLGAGLVNETYRVERAGRRYSLRIPAPNPEDLGVDRAFECRVLARAAAAGIAPPIERCEPLAGVLVAHWVEGSPLSPQQAREPDNSRAVALLARRVHGLPIPEAPRCMNPASWASLYRRAIERRMPEGRHRAGLHALLDARLAALAAMPGGPPVLCHSDLHAANLVAAAGGLILLDWEYAHVSDPLWDLAGWSCNQDLSAEERVLFLSHYLGRAPRDEERVRLDHFAWLYDYVCVLWSELFAARGGAEGQAVRARAEVLAERLNGSSSRGRELPAH